MKKHGLLLLTLLAMSGIAQTHAQTPASPGGMVQIPAGEFWMGSEQYSLEKPVHRVSLDAFWIARTPVTNAQYALFVKAAGYTAPDGWEAGRPPKGQEAHP